MQQYNPRRDAPLNRVKAIDEEHNASRAKTATVFFLVVLAITISGIRNANAVPNDFGFRNLNQDSPPASVRVVQMPE